jgi:hypothetical protein
MTAQDIWERKHQRLRVGLAISGAVLGIAVITPIITTIIDRTTPRDPTYLCIDCWNPGFLVFLALAPPALIATTAFAISYGVHSRRRPTGDRLGFGPGGLRWRF